MTAQSAMTTQHPETSSSKFRPPSVHQVHVGGFLGSWIETVAATTVHTLLQRCLDAGMLDQVDPDRPNPGLRIPFQSENNTVSTQMFWDSDFGKSIEAASYTLLYRRDPVLERQIDQIVDAYARLQAEDGYLNSWYLRIESGKRWTNLRDCHELYNAGHLMEGAVAYFHATGKRQFLDIMARYADHIATIFGPGEGQLRGYCGHPEVELALVKLARATGERRYLDLARFFVDMRGMSRTIMTKRRGAGERIRKIIILETTNIVSRISQCASSDGWSVMPFVRPISMPVWLTSPPSSATKV